MTQFGGGVVVENPNFVERENENEERERGKGKGGAECGWGVLVVAIKEG